LKLKIVIMTIALTGVPALAQNAAPKKTLKVLKPEEVDPGRLLPPPPPDGSESQQKELAAVMNLIKTRTPERFQQAKWDANHEDPTAFASVIGPAFELKKLPATSKLLEIAINEQSVVASAAKEYFHRKVPVTAASGAEAVSNYQDWTCDEVVRKPSERPLRSYPSAHSTMGFSIGIVLASLMPEKSQAILARAADYAYSREVCGDHYHSDIEASHALGTAIGMALLQNETLKPQIEAAREELRAAHLTNF
jgi:acid phosphatase (class A)